MKEKLKALKLILDEVHISSDIASVEERKKVQKGIFLSQEMGIDLGFHFGWYKMGPYSPELTKDYYELAEQLSRGDTEFSDYQLAAPVKRELHKIAEIIIPPSDVKLTQEDWMELLASYLFLMKHYGTDETMRRINLEKPRLAPFIKKAEEALKEKKIPPN